MEWASKLLVVKPDQLEEALVARFINPGGFGSSDFVVVPSSPQVRGLFGSGWAFGLLGYIGGCVGGWVGERIKVSGPRQITMEIIYS